MVDVSWILAIRSILDRMDFHANSKVSEEEFEFWINETTHAKTSLKCSSLTPARLAPLSTVSSMRRADAAIDASEL